MPAIKRRRWLAGIAELIAAILVNSSGLRASDAIHLALAAGEKARTIATFDSRQREAASNLSLLLLP